MRRCRGTVARRFALYGLGSLVPFDLRNYALFPLPVCDVRIGSREGSFEGAGSFFFSDGTGCSLGRAAVSCRAYSFMIGLIVLNMASPGQACDGAP